jgi:hypothetical protein
MWVSLGIVPRPEIIYFFVPHSSHGISLLSSRFCRPVLSILLLPSCHFRRTSVVPLLPPILPCRSLACNLFVSSSIFSSIFVTSFSICVLVICTGSSCRVLRHSEERGDESEACRAQHVYNGEVDPRDHFARVAVPFTHTVTQPPYTASGPLHQLRGGSVPSTPTALQ